MTSLTSLRKRVDKLQREQTQAHRWRGGPLEVVEVRLSEPLEVREARIAEAEARALAAGWCLPPGVDEWFMGCGVGPMLVIVELPGVADVVV